MTKIEKCLFFTVIILLPSQLSWHFWPTIETIKSDYQSITVYVSDLIIFGLFVIMLFHQKKYLRSTLATLRTPWHIALLLLVLINVAFSQSPLLSVYRYLQLMIFSLTLFVYLRSPSAQKIFFMTFPLSLIWVSVLGIFQFALNRSIGGWVWWLGERPLSLVAQGVSTIDLGWQGVRLLRPYSVFPHPNALAGFLLVGILMLINQKFQARALNSKFHSLIRQAAIALSVAVIIMCLSVNSLVVGVIILILKELNLLPKKINKLTKLIVLVVVLALGLFVHFHLRNSSFIIRLELFQHALGVISTHQLTGTGFGAYLYGLSDQLTATGGFYQPVHNVSLLLVAELGIPLTLVIGILVLKKLLPQLSSQNHWPLLGVLLLSLFDHYWITSHANMILLVIVLCLSYIPPKTHEPNSDDR